MASEQMVNGTMAYIGFLFCWYLSVGVAIYITCALKDAINGFKLLKAANAGEVIMGFLGIPFWPVVLWSLL